jgi:hypothetical protein
LENQIYSPNPFTENFDLHRQGKGANFFPTWIAEEKWAGAENDPSSAVRRASPERSAGGLEAQRREDFKAARLARPNPRRTRIIDRNAHSQDCANHPFRCRGALLLAGRHPREDLAVRRILLGEAVLPTNSGA